MWPVRRLLLFLLLCSLHGHSAGAPARGRRAVNLQEARISVSYRLALEKALGKLRIWLASNHYPPINELEKDVAQFNIALVGHLQWLYEEHAGVAAGRQCILAVMHEFRHLKASLAGALDSVRSWEALEPVSLRVPVPPLVLNAIVAFAFLRGFTSTTVTAARDWISMAVGCLISFDGLLRPGEWSALCPRLVAVPQHRYHGITSTALCTILNEKNRRVFGKIQIAIVECERAIAWLTWLSEGMPREALYLPGGTAKFQNLFKVAVKELGLEHLNITPGGLRAGGATFKFTNNIMDIGKLKFRGRWASLSTLEHYIQEASATLIMMQMPLSQTEFLEKLVSAGERFQLPPALPWTAFFCRARQRNGLARIARSGQGLREHPL